MKKINADIIILKIVTLIFVSMFAIALMSSCGMGHDGSSANTDNGYSEQLEITDYYDNIDTDTDYNKFTAVKINLADESISINGSGAAAKGSVVTITALGTYYITGKLSDGQLVINNTADKELIHLIFDRVDITCSDSAPVYIVNSERTVITLAESSENIICDSSPYILTDLEKEEPDAAIFSKDDLTINGNGSLYISANYNHGIHGKDDLKIINTNIEVISVNDAVKGRDSVVVVGSELKLTTGGDGIQSNNTGEAEASEEQEKTRLYGVVLAENSDIDINSQNDGIQAVNYLLIKSGSYNITTNGGSIESVQSGGFMGFGYGYDSQGNEDDGMSAKALKADAELVIEDGEFIIDSNDDSVHSNGNVTICGGNWNIYSSDDGIHADSTLSINKGTINIIKSYEGLEGNSIIINGGDLSVTASDDGINAAGTESEQAEANPGKGNMQGEVGNSNININGGTLYVNAAGDGVDANGTIYINGGTVTVDGPTNSGNGAIDFYNGLEMNGGFLIAVGSTGMAEGVTSAGNEVCALNITLSSFQIAGTAIRITDENNTDIVAYTPAKAYQSVIICSENLKINSTYMLYIGETLQENFSITQKLTTIGSEDNMMKPNNMQTPPN